MDDTTRQLVIDFLMDDDVDMVAADGAVVAAVAGTAAAVTAS